MADIIRSVAGTAEFVPEYWSQYALNVLRANVPLLQTVSTDSDWAEVGWRGKTLHIPYAGRFAVTSKSEDTPISPATPTGGTGVQLTLSNHDVVPFAIEDFTRAVAQPQILERYLESAAIALAENVEANLWTQGVANFTLSYVGTYTTDITAATVRAAKRALDEAKAPTPDRYLVVSPKDQVALLADDDLKEYFAFSQAASSGGRLEEGRVGTVYGLDVRMSQLGPLSVANQTNAAYHRNAILFASRPLPPAPAGAGVLQATAMDPDSGLTLRTSYQFDINAIAVRVNMEILYGIVALRPTQGLVVRS